MRKKAALACVGLLVVACAYWRMNKKTDPKHPYTEEEVIDKAIIAAAQPYHGMKWILSKRILEGGALHRGAAIVGSTVQFYQLGQRDPITIEVWYYPSGYDVYGPYPTYKRTKYAGYWYYSIQDDFHMIH